jgi:dTDP-4-amino-4,6-dideoxygalactose transaminase
MADMDALMELAARHRMRVIEDAAQAIGAEGTDGRRAGTLGDIGCFSFFPSKNLGAFGDAGMCVTNDAGLAERLRIVRAHGSRPKYHHAIVGGNFRLDELQAAVLLVKLRYLDDWTARRQDNARTYDRLFAATCLGDRISTPRALPGRHIFNQYVVRVARRDALRPSLAAAGVGTEIYYPVALHVQKCFEHLGYAPDDCPESVRASQEVLALPIYPELTVKQQRHVVASIAAFYTDDH